MTAGGQLLNLGQFQGLSEAEAAERRSPSSEAYHDQQARQVRRQIWRSSTFSIFNMSMIGLAIAQVLLGDPLNALVTLGIFILSVSYNAVQQLYATRQVEKILDLAQPQATAIRDGQIKSVEVDEIVEGDFLVVGPGDEFLADGLMLKGRIQVFDATEADIENKVGYKGEGDLILSGDFCLDGRGVIKVTNAPAEAGIIHWSPVQKKTELTPLQRIISRVLRLMLTIIGIFLIFLVIDMLGFSVLNERNQTIYREIASVFFSIAPSGLFFMIVATYALGSARLGELGALVRDSRAVESLAQITVLCFSKTGTLTGADLHLDMIPLSDGQPALPESRVRQILGDVVHNAQGDNLLLQAIAKNLQGSKREFEESAWYYSAYGWSAVSSIEADIHGTYFIGEPEILRTHLDEADTQDEEAGQVSTEIKGLRGFFGRVGQAISRENQEPGDEEAGIQPQLLFAYSPQPTSLYDDHGQPQLTDGLIPLCAIQIEEKIRPEARAAVEAFTESDVNVKILSTDDPEPVLKAAEQLGLVDDQSKAESSITGFQLSRMAKGDFERTARQAIVFSQLTSDQKGQIVDTLLAMGDRVAMVGDAVGDVPAMTAGDMSLSLQNSSQAALRTADIVLLEDSFQVLPTVLENGQQIVNGLLDILKINLVQIGYIFLLMVVMLFTSQQHFFYHPTHGGVVVFLTIIVPSVGLTFWASAGTVPRQYMRSRILHFVVPASLTMAIAMLVIGAIFGLGRADYEYSQLAVTHGLVVMGLLLIVFVQPPTRFWEGGDVLSGDWRMTFMAIGLLLTFLLATILPITQELLRLSTLQSPIHYVIVGAVVVIWLFSVRAIWRAPWLSRYVGILSKRLEGNP